MGEALNKETPFVVVGSRPWNRRVFDETIAHLAGRWHYIGTQEELTAAALHEVAPRYVFFLHWSWKVPAEIIRDYECVCFHMTDVPYGRGGSPLQNLIVRGHRRTKLTALRMTERFDEGPVYLKRDLCLEGNAEEIFIRATRLSAEMIEQIVAEEPEPVAQTGDAVVFKRRTPAESEVPSLPTLQALHDFIRMLDAQGYPRAYLEHGGFRYEFRQAALYSGRVEAGVTITPIEDSSV